MKRIKVYCIFISVVLIASALLGCRPPHYYNYDNLKNDVEKVEIILLPEYPETEFLVIKILDEEETELMFIRLSEIKFTYPFGDPPPFNGYGIRIYYNNNTYEIVCWGGTRKFNQYGESLKWYKRWCSKEKFKNLLSEFIDVTEYEASLS